MVDIGKIVGIGALAIGGIAVYSMYKNGQSDEQQALGTSKIGILGGYDTSSSLFGSGGSYGGTGTVGDTKKESVSPSYTYNIDIGQPDSGLTDFFTTGDNSLLDDSSNLLDGLMNGTKKQTKARSIGNIVDSASKKYEGSVSSEQEVITQLKENRDKEPLDRIVENIAVMRARSTENARQHGIKVSTKKEEKIEEKQNYGGVAL